MIEYYLELLKNPEMQGGVPQTGTALWEINKLVEAGLGFPEDEIKFIESLADKGHFEQQVTATMLLKTIGQVGCYEHEPS